MLHLFSVFLSLDQNLSSLKNDHKFNTASNNSQNMFIIYVIDLSTQKRWKDGVHIFTKIKNTDGWKKKKYLFFSYFVSGIAIFYYMAFIRKFQCLVGALL